MEFWITIVALVRRRRVIIPAVLIGMAMGGAAYLHTPSLYVSDTTMVLTTTQYGGTESRDPTKPTDLTNPMLNFNDSLTTTSAILIEAMNTKAVDQRLGVAGSTQLIVDDGRTNPDLLGLDGPFLYVVGRSTSPEAAKLVVLNAQNLMREKLVSWQQSLNAPAKTYVSLAEVVPPSAPVPSRSRAVKHAIMGFAFGFVVSMSAAYLLYRRRARRRAREAARGRDFDPWASHEDGGHDELADPAPAEAAAGEPEVVGEHGREVEPVPTSVGVSELGPAGEIGTGEGAPGGGFAHADSSARASVTRRSKRPPALQPVPVKLKARSRHP